MKDKKKVLGFLIKFFAIFAVFHYLLVEQANTDFLQKAVATFQAGLLGLRSEGQSVFVGDSVFLIVASCTGIVSAIILGAIIFSLKKPPLKQKITVFLAGFVLLFLVNQVRLYFVLLTGIAFGVKVAEMAHVLSWYTTTAAIIFAWYYFTKKLTGEKDFAGFL